jgi:CO/xanthine dehydrogenase FAD-binding subunit
VKPPPLDYARATSVSHALELLRELGDDSKPIAGGQSLVPLLNLRLARPTVLVDVNEIEADDVAVVDDYLVTGALVRHRQLCGDEVVVSAQPLLAHAARFIGHPAIRNRGTVGGSLAHADAAAELPLVAMACGAGIVVASSAEIREVPAEEFFLGPFMTSLGPEELVLTVQWPRIGRRDAWGFAEIADRSGDFALAAAAIQIGVDDGGARSPRVAVAGIEGVPRRLPEVESALRRESWTDGELEETIDEAMDGEHRGESDDPHADHARHLAGEMVRRAAAMSRR